MLTGRAAELRPEINYLQPRVTVLVAPEDAPQPYAADGEYKELLAQSIRLFNKRQADTRRARNVGRAIPTSGSGRRRAKAVRNREAVYGTQQ